MGVDLVDVDDLRERSQVHDTNAVADVLDDGEVVGDEEVSEPQLLLEIVEQVEDLALDRDVERRDRLVAHDEVRVEREHPGDADALALAVTA